MNLDELEALALAALYRGEAMVFAPERVLAFIASVKAGDARLEAIRNPSDKTLIGSPDASEDWQRGYSVGAHNAQEEVLCLAFGCAAVIRALPDYAANIREIPAE